MSPKLAQICPQKLQNRTATGQSFWDLTETWQELLHHSPVGSIVRMVSWRGRLCYCKTKDESLSEIAGYQIAEALGLPLQPWLAFFRNEPANAWSGEMVTGILVERWTAATAEGPLWSPAQTHPQITGRALALGVFDRFEWPIWLFDALMTDLRLVDLEHIGPFMCWPPQRTPLKDYRKQTSSAFDEAYRDALREGVHTEFMDGITQLCDMAFADTIDFSGHPHGDNMKRVIVAGLEARRLMLTKILRATR